MEAAIKTPIANITVIKRLPILYNAARICSDFSRGKVLRVWKRVALLSLGTTSFNFSVANLQPLCSAKYSIHSRCTTKTTHAPFQTGTGFPNFGTRFDSRTRQQKLLYRVLALERRQLHSVGWQKLSAQKAVALLVFWAVLACLCCAVLYIVGLLCN